MFFVLLKGTSQYGALELHIDRIAEALSASGHRAEVLESGPEFTSKFLYALQQRPDVFLSLNGIGENLTIDGLSAYDRAGAIFASFYVDSPLFHLERLASPIRRKVALFLDKTHVQLAKAAEVGATFASIAFLPPGAITSAYAHSIEPSAFDRRDIELLFTGTFRGEPERPWLNWPDNPARTVVCAIVDRMAADADLPIYRAAVEAQQDLGIDPSPDRMAKLIPLLHVPQRFAEAHHRAAFVRTLGQAGVRVTIFGQGWEGIAQRYPSLDYQGRGSFAQTLELLPRTRIVLNTNNGFVAGAHERVFTAMGAGAHVFTDTSTFYTRAFDADRELSTFRWTDLAEVPARLEQLLADGEALAARAEAGRARVLREHGWASRIDGLLAAFKDV